MATGGFALAGRSERPDPAIHAYRQDLADIALAGRVIASHYAEPLRRYVSVATSLLKHADDGAAVVDKLAGGDAMEVLDCSIGWAWGYAGPGRRVGYVRAETLRA